MAAIRCSGAGHMLLRRAPGLLRQAALVSEQGVLHRQPIRALAPSSNRYISSYLSGLLDFEKKRLATDLMKESSPDNEIENLDELLNLMSFKYACSDQHKIQAEAARSAIQDKKLELVSLLLRPDSGDEYKEKMKELADVARRHRESLVLEDLKAKCERAMAKCKQLEEHQCHQAKLIAGIVFWGLPLTLITFAKWH